MATLPIATKSELAQLPSQRLSQLGSPNGREILHDLMNHLTVIDLCAFQLRSTVYPSALSALERAVENAMITAKQLAVELRAETIKPRE